tara:strand:+ start:4371 stop:4685 length:315 start_codon:yes stop_codon:yes gene_type:complete
MRASELKPGMLLRPKDGFIFVRYDKTENMHEHLEAVRIETVNNGRRVYMQRSPGGSEKPVIYVCRRPKSNPDSPYEYRHEVYVPALGRSMRMASEYWRNVEEVK